MATAKEQIDQLSTKVDGLSAITTDVAADFAAFRDAVAADRENLSESAQAALDVANAKLDAAQARLSDLDVAVGDADGSDVPAPTDGGVDGGIPVDSPINPEDPDAPRPTS